MERPTVLVADDDAGIRELLVEELEARGFSVLAAADGLEAAERLDETQRPLVLVLDLMMPRLSGLDLLELLARRADARRFAVLVATANPDGARTRSSPNVLQVFQKPFDLEELLLAVEAASTALSSGGRGSTQG